MHFGGVMGRTGFSVVAVATFVVACWGIWAIYAPSVAYWAMGDIFVPTQAGTWGNSFGAFNALFGALGFAAVLGTLLIQGRAIRHQQEDQHRQRFESSYFELLHLFREARNAIKFKHTPGYNLAKKVKPLARMSTYEGQDAFRAAMLEVRHWIQDADLPADSDRNALGNVYRARIHIRYESKLGPYFRLMYTILQRISSDPVLSPQEKARYGNLLRSQITSHEAAMAGLNGLVPVSKDFSRLVIEFRLLKYLPNGTMRRTLERHYPVEAFQERD